MLTDQQLQKQIDQQLAEIEKLRGYKGEDEVISLAELQKDLANQKEQFNFSCGIPSLDNLLGGFEEGELIIISGITKNGKTALMVTFTNHFEIMGLPTLWFQFEETARQFLRRFKIIPQTVYAPKHLTNHALLWIKSKILEAMIKYNVKAIFIDHLGFVQDKIQQRDRRIEIDTLIRALKTMAIELKITIFLAHHIRQIEPGTVPSFEFLKESSAVGQDADTVLMIWREFKKGRGGIIDLTGKTILSIELDRDKGVYKKYIPLVFQNGEFKELEENLTFND